jgi:hypothetical protein
LIIGKNFPSNDVARNNQVGLANSNSDPIVTATSKTTPSAITSPESRDKPPNSVQDSSNIQQRGWIRIGAVNSTDGRIFVGQQLMKTTQPVTISPSIVPNVGSHVTIINSVNIRVSAPQPPSYTLPLQKAAFPPGQEVVIINTDAFIDPHSPSPLTVVWAEIGIKQSN